MERWLERQSYCLLVAGLVLSSLTVAAGRASAAPPGTASENYGGSQSLFLPDPAKASPLGENFTVLENGILWQLTSYRTASGEMAAPLVYRMQGPTIQFEEGRIGGNATCNRYFGSYERGEGELTITPGGSTLMACPDEYMVQEQAYLAALEQVRTYDLTEGELVLRDASGNRLLTFKEFEAPAITGTRWRLVTYNNGTGGMVTPLADTVILSKFEENGELAGFAGCNNYMASYQITANSLSIGPAASTRKTCASPAGVMEQEMAFLQLLETVAAYAIEGNSLQLNTADGTAVARFVAADSPESAP